MQIIAIVLKMKNTHRHRCPSFGMLEDILILSRYSVIASNIFLQFIKFELNKHTFIRIIFHFIIFFASSKLHNRKNTEIECNHDYMVWKWDLKKRTKKKLKKCSTPTLDNIRYILWIPCIYPHNDFIGFFLFLLILVVEKSYTDGLLIEEGWHKKET